MVDKKVLSTSIIAPQNVLEKVLKFQNICTSKQEPVLSASSQHEKCVSNDKESFLRLSKERFSFLSSSIVVGCCD